MKWTVVALVILSVVLVGCEDKNKIVFKDPMSSTHRACANALRECLAKCSDIDDGPYGNRQACNDQCVVEFNRCDSRCK